MCKTEPTCLWRCRTCGQWSHAKRRPSTHQRRQQLHEYGEHVGHIVVNCGPFERWIAQHADPCSPRPEPPSLGRTIRVERYDYDDYGSYSDLDDSAFVLDDIPF